VIVYIPEGRDNRRGPGVSSVLTTNAPSSRDGRESFVGSKPEAWTHWVLEAMGYDPAIDDIHDLFPGSGRVSDAIETFRVAPTGS
jgi:hypothetical protein